jgi:hypothetical protein
VQPESGDLGSLGVDEVMAQASAWLKGKGRG